MFYYCEQDQAWVFTIRAVAQADRPKSDCLYGWLMQSPLTKAFNLEDVGPEGWQIWTESPKKVGLAFTCNQCLRDSDCGGRGICDTETRECGCYDNHTGSRCQTEVPFCPFVENVVYGESALEYKRLRTFKLETRNDSAVLLYNRPTFSDEVDSYTSLLFYSGTRWFYSVWDTTFLNSILEHSPTVKDRRSDDINSFHGYWHFNVTARLFEKSDPTDSDSPVGIKWNLLNDNAAIGESAPYGVAFPFKQDYLCYGNCKDESCGLNGGCDEDKNLCICKEEVGAGGNYCEFNMNDSYVLPLVYYFVQNANQTWFNRSDYEYVTKYWSHWPTDAQLYKQLLMPTP
jgi:hypothetical protein